MNREWFITVFKNRNGLIDYENGCEESENYLEFTMDEKEFSEHIEKKIFDAINEKCDLLIDNYESEVIPAKYTSICIRLCKTLKVSKETVFYKALEKADKIGFGLALDF